MCGERPPPHVRTRPGQPSQDGRITSDLGGLQSFGTTTIPSMPNIIVVTDEPWVANDVRAALSEARFLITEVGDPRRAVEACREHEAAAVVIDLQVGSMGGMAVTRAVREAIGNGSLQPVVTLLLLDRRADAFLAGRAGADAWVHKPFGAFELRDSLDRLLTPAGATDGGTTAE